MHEIEKFEDIETWKEARSLVKDVYEVFSLIRDYGLRDQIQKAAVSIMSYIAEGFDRESNKEFIQFLVVARGSASEVRSFPYAALDIGYLNASISNNLQNRCLKISNLINGFIRYLKSTEHKK